MKVHVMAIGVAACLLALTRGAGAASGRGDIIVLDGIDYQDHRVHEALAGYTGGEVTYANIDMEVGLAPKMVFPPGDSITEDQLKKAGLLILTNAPAPALSPQTRQSLKKNIEDGMSVLILGGLFSFGKGQYEGTEMEEICPVTIKSKWSVRKLDPPMAIQAAGEAFSSFKASWEQKPSVLYHHDVRLKPGTRVWLKAGNVPILVVRRMGRGYTAGFLSAPIGKPPEGTLAYWEWEDWPKLLRGIADRLMDK